MQTSLQIKLLGTFLIVILIFLLVLGATSLTVNSLTDSIEKMQELESKVELTNNLLLLISKLLKPANHYVITGDISERDHFDQLISDVSGTIKKLQTFSGDPAWEALEKEIMAEILLFSEMLIAVMFIENPVGKESAANQIKAANLFYEGLIRKAEKFRELSTDQMVKMSTIARSKKIWVQIVFYGTMATAFLFIFLLSLYLSRGIIKPMLKLHQGSQIVSRGDLDHRITIDSNDEIGELARQFNGMVQAFSDTKKELDRKIKETQRLAITDALTGLYNHRFCMEKIKEEIKRAERYERPLSIIFADIDFFKSYNDTHGHINGDNLLQMMGTILKTQVRDADFVCRSGGEEFVIILPETKEGVALKIAERLRKAIEDYPFPHKETQPNGNLTVSVGVAFFVKGLDFQKMIKAADDALYHSKRSGKNRVTILT